MESTPESTTAMIHDRAQHIVTGKNTDHQSMIETSSSSSEEEEDMANCLIMLAQSASPVKKDKTESEIFFQKTKRLKIRRVTELAAINGGGNSGYQSLYECRTCNRSFPSFQALGGHRASHKKPKPTVINDMNSVEDQPAEPLVEYEENKIITKKYSSSPVTPDFIQKLYKNSKTTKVHECSICGSEFLSGQALGGHMRRHRIAPASVSPTKPPESSNLNEKSLMLSLDLNLPPPEFVFSVAALVDCHY